MRNVRFETSFHVREVGQPAVVAAITEVLRKTGLDAVTSSRDPARQVFIRDWHGWTSFGEIAHRGEAIAWGKRLSRALHAPVLEVLSDATSSELRAHVEGRLASSVAVLATVEEFVVDLALLAPFGVKKKLKVRLPFNPFFGTGDKGAAVDAIGAALALAQPVLAGRIKGLVLGFE